MSFICEFKKEDILQNLNAPANNFKELTPGTQYWSKVSIDKTPKNVPNQCNYNSQHLKDDVVNFLKTHCLISDYVLGNVIHFVDKYSTSIAFDTIKINNKIPQVNVYYLGTADGKILKVSSFDSSSIISEWKLSEPTAYTEMFSEIKINSNTQQLYALTESFVYQINLNQCEHHRVCSTCMKDPYCGWNMNKNMCQDVSSSNSASSKNIVSLNEAMCSSIQKPEGIAKTIHLEYGAHVELECKLDSRNYEYLFDFIEWKKDQQPIDFSSKSNQNLYLTWNKNILVINKAFNDTNSNVMRENTVFSCFINKNELMSSYNIIYKQSASNGLKNVQEVSQGSSINQSKL